jgi:hypothetical protein
MTTQVTKEMVQAAIDAFDNGETLEDCWQEALEAAISVNQKPIATDKEQGWCPDVCPLTGTPFFMWINHYQTGQMVPTYGGPFDSYTIPVKGDDGSYCRERFDHDRGHWLENESYDVGLVVIPEEDYEPKSESKNRSGTDCEAKELLSLDCALSRQRMNGLQISLVNKQLFKPLMDDMYAIDPVKAKRFLANINIEEGQGIA